jgi:hypothetical protein
MKVEQRFWTADKGWGTKSTPDFPQSGNLVLAFGNRFLLEREDLVNEVLGLYPNSDVIFNSTSGEIYDNSVFDDSIVVTAIHFEKTTYEIVEVEVERDDEDASYGYGRQLAQQLLKEDLRHIFIISDGSAVNGSELARSLNENLPKEITTTGGLAGDGARFEKTLVGWNALPAQGKIIAIGLYGDDIHVGYGSAGGWDPFGPRRKVTKSKNNVLFELDGKSALELYKKYLGEKAKGLPATALLFPLSITTKDETKPLVRTILSINEEKQSMTFAGDIPEGATVQLMKANFDKLIDGAYEAAESGKTTLSPDGNSPGLAILISCVGRKLVLDQRIEEEVESVREIIGNQIPMAGFYSYGELSPFAGFHSCRLHNQTMTITLMGEA